MRLVATAPSCEFEPSCHEVVHYIQAATFSKLLAGSAARRASVAVRPEPPVLSAGRSSTNSAVDRETLHEQAFNEHRGECAAVGTGPWWDADRRRLSRSRCGVRRRWHRRRRRRCRTRWRRRDRARRGRSCPRRPDHHTPSLPGPRRQRQNSNRETQQHFSATTTRSPVTPTLPSTMRRRAGFRRGWRPVGLRALRRSKAKSCSDRRRPRCWGLLTSPRSAVRPTDV